MKTHDYTKLKELLEGQETFPLHFLFKFIGANTPAFAAGVADLEKTLPKLRLDAKRPSAQGNHLAMTYSITAANADEIIAIYKRIAQVPDIHMVL